MGSLGVDPVRRTQPSHINVHPFQHVRVFTYAVDQSVVTVQRRRRDLDLLVVKSSLVDQHEANPHRTFTLAHELLALSRATSGIDAKKIKVMMIAEITQY
jgi:hypothetical protein